MPVDVVGFDTACALPFGLLLAFNPLGDLAAVGVSDGLEGLSVGSGVGHRGHGSGVGHAVGSAGSTSSGVGSGVGSGDGSIVGSIVGQDTDSEKVNPRTEIPLSRFTGNASIGLRSKKDQVRSP